MVGHVAHAETPDVSTGVGETAQNPSAFIPPGAEFLQHQFPYMISQDGNIVGTEESLAKHDPVNHPSHYTSHPSGVECITIARHMGFNLGNALKYLWRAGKKNGAPTIQDLEKAIFYIQDEIRLLKEQSQ